MRFLALTLALLTCGLSWAEEAPAAEEAPKTEEAKPVADPAAGMSLEDEGSYMIGVRMAMQAAQARDMLGLNDEKILEGVRDALAGEKLKVDIEQRWQLVLGTLEAKAKEKQAAAGDVNLAKGKKYLEGLRGKKGITFTDSGIAYEVLAAAEGARPTDTSTVKVHYRGTTIDGKEFDSSYSRGEPASFPLNRVIKGWTEGLQLMPTGSKYRFHIPSELAYGTQAPPSIGPNQVLVFEVELLEIVK